MDDIDYINQLEEHQRSNCGKLQGRPDGEDRDNFCADCGDCPITYRIRQVRKLAVEVAESWKSR